MLAHALLSRVLFDLAFVFGAVFREQGLDPGRERPWPGLAAVIDHLAESAVSYGDFGWYRLVARRGYDAAPFAADMEHNWAFFPLHPLLIRLVERPELQFLAAHAAFLGSIGLLFAYLRRATDEKTATAAALLVAYFPFSFSISQFRPEPFLLFFSVLALWLAQRGRRWDAAIAAAVAGLAKPNAFLLSLLLLPEAWRRRPRLDLKDVLSQLRPSTIVLLAAPASGLVFMSLHLWGLTGDPFAWAKIQSAWGAKFLVTPGQHWRDLFAHPMLVGRGGWDPVLLNWLAFFAAALGLAALLAKRRFVFAGYVALYVGLTFSNHGVFVIGKHLSTCFPAFVGLALLLRREQLLQLAVILSAALLTLNGLFGGLGFLFVRA
ncbi:MAG: hypothetical protein IT546_14600 [Caulobacteraceae bacterium]|nr:hypothetical protein [Caulobacteraceae bacterium]